MPRITSKGQVTIPKRIRVLLGLKSGSVVEFTVGGDGQIIVNAHQKGSASRFDALVGSAGPGMSTDELMALTRGWGEPDREGR